MTHPLRRLAAHGGLNYWLTNRLVPRRTATRLVGKLSRIERPLVARAGIALWRLFGDVDLSDAAETRFASVHACFTRRLRPGARPFDPDPAVIASPCDAIVGTSGRIAGDVLMQVKGSAYSLAELLGDVGDAARMVGGHYVTLRLTAGMYHHFHAPHDLVVERVRYLPGDCWNVNPPTLARVAGLYCRNERAAIHARLADGGGPVVLVAVAAVLVAGIRLTAVDGGLRALADDRLALDVAAAKGDELGWFEHGSTIVLLVPPAFAPEGLAEGRVVRAGTALFRQTAAEPDG